MADIMTERTSTATWSGTLFEGSGSFAVGSGAFGPQDVSWARRAGEPEGVTSPEELVAAAGTELADRAINGRKLRAAVDVRNPRSPASSVYQDEFDDANCTASRDLDDLVGKGILEKTGTTGKCVHYRLGKGAAKGPMGPKVP